MTVYRYETKDKATLEQRTGNGKKVWIYKKKKLPAFNATMEPTPGPPERLYFRSVHLPSTGAVPVPVPPPPEAAATVAAPPPALHATILQNPGAVMVSVLFSSLNVGLRNLNVQT